MQNSIGKFKQISIVLQKPGILFKNLRILTSSNYPTVQYFLLKLRTRFLLIYKRVCGIFFLFCLDLKLFAKIKKNLVPTHLFFTFLLINQDLNKIRQSWTAFCRHYKTCTKFQQKKLNSMIVGAQTESFFQTKTLLSWK